MTKKVKYLTIKQLQNRSKLRLCLVTYTQNDETKEEAFVLPIKFDHERAYVTPKLSFLWKDYEITWVAREYTLAEFIVNNHNH